MTTKEWRHLLKKLRKQFPVSARVVVKRYPCKWANGSTSFDGSTYRIRINTNQHWTAQIDTLLHEWAHVQAIEQSYAHGPSWSAAYATIYDWNRSQDD